MKLISWLVARILRLNLLLIVATLIVVIGISMPNALADSTVNEVKVSLGNESGELKFFPSNIQLETGKQYKLLLDNPSPVKHYFTAKDFADASWTKKVEASKVEVKGAIHELELKPGAEAEWFLTPMKPGNYELHCSIKGHAPAGMVGEIIVEN
ncbi:cupredoxin domain-containing protein [Myxosarcina sp. GI1]|uniref:cupredoxin domain-containing protein n=1 Tax=Myxosarcina sp. GI1 TaxID=1541065 RepID=UPI00056444D9|nr:cupredoxin domain-containing protein [Myxosarcina sp. GI1]